MAKRTVPKIVLNLPKSVPDVLVYGRSVVQAMTNNAYFPTPHPPLNQVTTDLDALEAAEAGSKSRAKGAAAARDLKLEKVHQDLEGLQAYVQSIIAANPAQAAAIQESSGMEGKQSATRQKPDLEVKLTDTPGQVHVVARAADKFAAYEWQYSADGKNWTPAGITTVADQFIPSLTVGTTYAFRYRTTMGRVTGDWSQDISFVMH